MLILLYQDSLSRATLDLSTGKIKLPLGQLKLLKIIF